MAYLSSAHCTMWLSFSKTLLWEKKSFYLEKYQQLPGDPSEGLYDAQAWYGRTKCQGETQYTLIRFFEKPCIFPWQPISSDLRQWGWTHALPEPSRLLHSRHKISLDALDQMHLFLQFLVSQDPGSHVVELHRAPGSKFLNNGQTWCSWGYPPLTSTNRWCPWNLWKNMKCS